MAFWGDVAVHWEVLLGGGQPCNGQCTCGHRHSGGCCGASGGVVGREVAVGGTVGAEGREGGATDHTGVVCRSVYGQRSSAMGSVVGGEVAMRRTMGQDAAVC